MTQGLLSAFQVASDYEKLQAFKHQQDEIDALRNDRMAAARAKYAGDVRTEGEAAQLSPFKVAGEIANSKGNVRREDEGAATSDARVFADINKNLAEGNTAPFKGKLDIADIKSKLSLLPGQTRQAQGEIETNDLTRGDRQVASLNRSAADVAKSEHDLEMGDIKNELDKRIAQFQLDTTDDDQELRLRGLKSKLAQAETPEDLDYLKKKLDIEEGRAKVNLTKAEANRYNADAELKASKAFDVTDGKSAMEAAKSTSMIQAKILARPLNNGLTVAQYQTALKNGDTEADAEGDKALEALKSLRDQEIEYISQAHKYNAQKDAVRNERYNKAMKKDDPAVTVKYKSVTQPDGQVISTQEEYDKLAPGESFVWGPTKQPGIKPKD